jgi:hypothetical protein
MHGAGERQLVENGGMAPERDLRQPKESFRDTAASLSFPLLTSANWARHAPWKFPLTALTARSAACHLCGWPSKNKRPFPRPRACPALLHPTSHTPTSVLCRGPSGLGFRVIVASLTPSSPRTCWRGSASSLSPVLTSYTVLHTMQGKRGTSVAHCCRTPTAPLVLLRLYCSASQPGGGLG